MASSSFEAPRRSKEPWFKGPRHSKDPRFKGQAELNLRSSVGSLLLETLRSFPPEARRDFTPRDSAELHFWRVGGTLLSETRNHTPRSSGSFTSESRRDFTPEIHFQRFSGTSLPETWENLTSRNLTSFFWKMAELHSQRLGRTSLPEVRQNSTSGESERLYFRRLAGLHFQRFGGALLLEGQRDSLLGGEAPSEIRWSFTLEPAGFSFTETREKFTLRVLAGGWVTSLPLTPKDSSKLYGTLHSQVQPRPSF